MGHGDPTATKSLIGASIPRSGHHYLQRILTDYYGPALFYCEVYSQRDCCKQVPCTRRGGHRITYQKSHDRDFALPRDVAGALYLVQYRHPVPEVLSDRELDLRDGLGRKSISYRRTRDYYGWWLATKAQYYRKFHDKWFQPRLTNGVYLDYAEVAADPAAAIAPIIEWTDGSVDDEHLARAIGQASSTRGGKAAAPQSSAFTPRVIEASPHFDPDLLAPFEAYVLRHAPHYGYTREFSGGYEHHWLYGLILTFDEEEPLPKGERDRLDAAARLAPDHPEIRLRLAKRELDAGNAQRAVTILDETVARNPSFGQGYRLLVQACKAAGQKLPASALTSEALFACSECPGALVEVAAAMRAEDMIVNALAALSVAVVLEPESHRTNQILAEILANQGRWVQARPYAEKAAELNPNNKQTQKILNRIRQHFRPSPADAAV